MIAYLIRLVPVYGLYDLYSHICLGFAGLGTAIVCHQFPVTLIYLLFFMSRSTARVILRWVVYRWRNQCILVGQDSAL